MISYSVKFIFNGKVGDIARLHLLDSFFFFFLSLLRSIGIQTCLPFVCLMRAVKTSSASSLAAYVCVCVCVCVRVCFQFFTLYC